MDKSLLPPCRHCQYCENIGRQQAQSARFGRKRYFCTHPKVKELKDKHGLPLYSFVGYGDMSAKSPLTLKTRKKWCPLENKAVKATPKEDAGGAAHE